jgi:hypothetical protein
MLGITLGEEVDHTFFHGRLWVSFRCLISWVSLVTRRAMTEIG